MSIVPRPPHPALTFAVRPAARTDVALSLEAVLRSTVSMLAITAGAHHPLST